FEEYLTTIINNNTTFEDNDFITVTGEGTAENPYTIEIKEGDVNSMLITNAAGELEWATIESIVKDNETLTVLDYNTTTNTLSYTDEEGNTKDIALNNGAIAYDNATNTIKIGRASCRETELALNTTNLDRKSVEKGKSNNDSHGEIVKINN